MKTVFKNKINNETYLKNLANNEIHNVVFTASQ